MNKFNEEKDSSSGSAESPLNALDSGLAWHEVAKREPPYGKRILIFSPEYPKGDVMRVRIVTWITAMTDATHWRELDEPGGSEAKLREDSLESAAPICGQTRFHGGGPICYQPKSHQPPHIFECDSTDE